MDEHKGILRLLMRERRRIIRALNRKDAIRTPARQQDIDRVTDHLEKELNDLKRRIRNPHRW